MGDITDRFANAFRDFSVAGVPASGANEPSKAEIRAIGQLLEQRIGGVAAGLRYYATKTVMDADTARPAGTLAYVYGDVTSANNTIYHYAPGGWVVDAGYASALAGVVQPLVTQAANSVTAAQTARTGAEVARDEAATIITNQTVVEYVGRPVNGVTGTSQTARRRVQATPFTGSGPVDVQFFALSASGSLILQRYTRTGNVFTAIGSPVTLTFSTAGLQTFPAAITVNAGEYISDKGSSSNTVATLNSGGVDTGGYYEFTTDGDTLTIVGGPVTDVQRQIGFRLAYLYTTKERVQAIEATAANGSAALALATSTADSLLDTQSIGRPGVPVTGGTMGARRRIWATPFSASGAVTVRYFNLSTSSGGNLKVRRFTKSGAAGVISPGDVFTAVGDEVALATGNTVGLKTFPNAISVTAGEYIGEIGSTSGVVASTSGTEPVGYYDFTTDGASLTVTTGSPTRTGFRQISFSLSYQLVTAAAVKSLLSGQGVGGSAAVSVPTVSDLDYEGFTLAWEVVGAGPGNAMVNIARDAGMVRIVHTSPRTIPPVVRQTAQFSQDNPNGSYRGANYRAGGLLSDTPFYYRIDMDGEVGTVYGPIRTAAAPGVERLHSMVGMTCVRLPTGAFNVMKSVDMDRQALVGSDTPMLFQWWGGDFEYSDIEADNLANVRLHNSRAIVNLTTVAPYVPYLPVVQTRSDHDGPGNDKAFDSFANYRTLLANGLQAQRERFPCRPVDHRVETQSVRVGRVTHVFLDTQTNNRRGTVSGTTPTKLGTNNNPPGSFDQLKWLFALLDQEDSGSTCDRIVLYSPAALGPDYDGWEQYNAAELALIVAKIESLGRVLVNWFEGDDHHSGVDDGTFLAAPIARVMSSPARQSATLGGGGDMIWNGNSTVDRSTTQQYVIVKYLANGEWTAIIKGGPFDPDTEAATTLATYNSADIVPKVAFQSAGGSGPAGAVADIKVKRVQIGRLVPPSVSWTATNGTSGTATFKPNGGLASLVRSDGVAITYPVGAAVTYTLSSPVGCTLGTQTTFTLAHT